jgi:hypothetical protein
VALARRTRIRVQVVLELMPGAEPWIKVEHARGWFKLPGWAQAQVVWEGANAGWTSSPPLKKAGEVRVSVPLTDYLENWGEQGERDRTSPATSSGRLS